MALLSMALQCAVCTYDDDIVKFPRDLEHMRYQQGLVAGERAYHKTEGVLSNT